MSRFFLLCVALLLVLPATRSWAQTPYALSSESSLWVEGKSNRDDWSVRAGEMTGTIALAAGEAAPVLRTVTLTVPSAQIRSGKSTIMDRLMHQALQVEEYPTIRYELVAAEPGPAPETGGFLLRTRGRLTLTGTTKEVTMDVMGTRLPDGRYRFKGQHPLAMSDYGIQAPTAMFGALHTADDVVVHFDLVTAPAR